MIHEKNEEVFTAEMKRAQVMRDLEADNEPYWRGYIRGLRRGYHGDNFGTSAEHKMYWNNASSDNADRATMGEGYRDGYYFFEEPKRGRISLLGETVLLFNLRVPGDLYARMEAASMSATVSIDDFRRSAYEHYCQSCENREMVLSSINPAANTGPLSPEE